MTRVTARWTVSLAGLPSTPEHCLSVDGMTPHGPNLSHWPGNRTPKELKADLSTGICLSFARAPESYRRRFLGGVTTVVNDHYDTDGFLSMLAVTRPDVALARAERCLAAAATGDYQCFHDDLGFATDRIVHGLLRSPASPLAAELARQPAERAPLLCYEWLLAHAEQVLDEPQTWSALYADELAAVHAEIERARAGAVVTRRDFAAQLGVVRSRAPLRRIVLNTCAAGAFRVLHLHESEAGLLVRYHDRTESWFEVVTFAPPPRRDLRILAARLQELERAAGSAATWCADPPTDPVPELYCGPSAPQEYGEITRVLTPTRIPAARLLSAFGEFLTP